MYLIDKIKFLLYHFNVFFFCNTIYIGFLFIFLVLLHFLNFKFNLAELGVGKYW